MTGARSSGTDRRIIFHPCCLSRGPHAQTCPSPAKLVSSRTGDSVKELTPNAYTSWRQPEIFLSVLYTKCNTRPTGASGGGTHVFVCGCVFVLACVWLCVYVWAFVRVHVCACTCVCVCLISFSDYQYRKWISDLFPTDRQMLSHTSSLSHANKHTQWSSVTQAVKFTHWISAAQ